MEFSTLNESSLHKAIKLYYAFKTNGSTEVNQNKHIYDIVTETNDVIEIQTKNLSKLLPKVLDTIEKGQKVTIVHPVPITTKILLTDEQNNKISLRTSPKKNSIYSIFKELTGIYPVLLDKNFTLEILEVNITEHRVRTSEPVQSKNNNRRFKKNWIKKEKKLNEILNTKVFNTKEDYLALLPNNLPEYFCAKDLQNELKKTKELPAKTYNTAHLIIWVYSHMNLITYTHTENRSKYYKINTNNI